MATQHKLRNVQALRAVAVLLVVGVHLSGQYGFEARYLKGTPVLGWLSIPGQLGVDLFFVISGLIMVLTTARSGRGVAPARAFLGRRVRRIYPPYWLVSLPLLALFLVAPTAINAHQATPPKPLESLLLLPQSGAPLLPVGWTLVYEMYFYLVFAAALLAPRRWLGAVIGGWALVTLALALTVQHSSSALLRTLANPLSFEFVAGVAIGFLVLRRPPRFALAPLLAGTGALVLVALLVSASGADEPSDWLRGLVVGPAAGLVVYGAIGLEHRGHQAPELLQRLGDASYSIYLLHVLALTALGRVLERALPYPGLHLPLVAAGIVTAVVTGALAYRWIERPVIRALQPARPSTDPHSAHAHSGR